MNVCSGLDSIWEIIPPANPRWSVASCSRPGDRNLLPGLDGVYGILVSNQKISTNGDYNLLDVDFFMAGGCFFGLGVAIFSRACSGQL